MNYYNIFLPDLDAPPFDDASSREIGDYVRLMKFCLTQENDGKIANAANWSPLKWARLSIDPPDRTASLWHFTAGGDLILHEYPDEKQREVQAKRAAAFRVAESRKRKRAERKLKRCNGKEIQLVKKS